MKTTHEMELIKKYTAVQITTNTINDNVFASLKYGEISEPYYDRVEPETEFETEQDSIKWAYKENKYANWLILPIIYFKHEYK